jgi:flagellar biosynthesis protein FliR
MDLLGMEILIYFYRNINILLIIFVRVLGFIIIMPVFNTASIPMITKIAFSIIFSYLIFTSGVVTEIYNVNNIAGAITLIIQEFLVGFIMAFTVYVIFSTIYFAGQLIDGAIGFSMVSVVDPMSQIQVPITGNLLYFVMLVFFINSGGLHNIVILFFNSYEAIPVGLGTVVGNFALTNILMDMMTRYFIFSMQIAIPFVGTILIVDMVLGILVKAVPQMNVFVVGIPIKIIVGLVLMYAIAPVFITVYQLMMDFIIEVFVNVARSMML